MGVLGRGGGGEVVKVKNRLDRRIYAIKKIILESERGKFAKIGEIQNQKLRREVKTISRMTHKNIVRYYQAWVEGGGGAETAIAEDDDTMDEESEDKSHGEKSGKSSESNSNNLGWWNNPDHGKENSTDKWGDESSNDNSSSGSSSSWSDDNKQSNSFDANGDEENFQLGRNLHSGSMVDLLEHENADLGFQVRNSLCRNKVNCTSILRSEIPRIRCFQVLGFKMFLIMVYMTKRILQKHLSRVSKMIQYGMNHL